MAVITKQKKLLEDSNGGHNANTPFSDIVAIGTVIDTNDPMQWGRVRVLVQAWGDSWEHNVEGMPWAMYVTPFGGQTSVGTRGPGIKQTEGGIAYGMWAIPKVGAQVVVMSLDEEHQQRIYLGCVFDAFSTHTMPHGRWMFEDHPELGDKPKAKPYGPYSSGDKLIQPLASNIQKAFGNSDQAFEWQTRAADYAVSRVDVSHLAYSGSRVQDDKATDSGDGWTSTQGYQTSRFDPSGGTGITDKNYDSQTYSITSPGFHSMSMDDRMENCRMRFRTMSGHQILLDDTNERIYISTAQGNNWVEMDQAGNIDIFSNSRVSIRAASDINMTSDKSIRMYAKEGIHMYSDAEIKAYAKTDIHLKTGNILFVESKSDTNVKSGAMVNVTSKADMNLKSGGKGNYTSDGATNIKAGGQIIQTGTQIHLNGPGAESAKEAKEALLAFYTNRVPAHEPWGRMITKKDTGHEGELQYSDKNVGKMEGGKEIPRNPFWRR